MSKLTILDNWNKIGIAIELLDHQLVLLLIVFLLLTNKIMPGKTGEAEY